MQQWRHKAWNSWLRKVLPNTIRFFWDRGWMKILFADVDIKVVNPEKRGFAQKKSPALFDSNSKYMTCLIWFDSPTSYSDFNFNTSLLCKNNMAWIGNSASQQNWTKYQNTSLFYLRFHSTRVFRSFFICSLTLFFLLVLVINFAVSVNGVNWACIWLKFLNVLPKIW